MKISEQIKVLCVRANISNAELARRLNVSPQSFSAKLRRESFSIQDLERIAEVTGSEFQHVFILPNGEKV
ncbi:MAG: helix-turn-helix domain containing protein [Clostridia bacterium]|nr:helix-turn-helix domain containing protein [Clostridia bacterium]